MQKRGGGGPPPILRPLAHSFTQSAVCEGHPFTPSLPAAGRRSREATEGLPPFVFTTLPWCRSGAMGLVRLREFRRLALSFRRRWRACIGSIRNYSFFRLTRAILRFGAFQIRAIRYVA